MEVNAAVRGWGVGVFMAADSVVGGKGEPEPVDEASAEDRLLVKVDEMGALMTSRNGWGCGVVGSCGGTRFSSIP